MVDTHSPLATTTATTLVPSQPIEHDNPYSPASPEFWVYAGITIFLLLAFFWLKAHRRIAEALDKRIAETVRELDEARQLRADAEAVLTQAKAKQAESHKAAEGIIAQAKVEAQEMVEDMTSAATDLITRRQKMAEDKVGAAERTAIAELRRRTAAAAAAAAATIISETHDAKADAPLVDAAIGKIGAAH